MIYYTIMYIKHWTPKILKCEHCGKSFTQKASNQKYCSTRCCEEAWGRTSSNSYERKCPSCGKLFTTVRSCQRYCSPECNQKGRYKYHTIPTHPLMKEYFLEKYDYTCQLCNRRFASNQLHCHHIKPIALGGEDGEDNITLLCRSCHAKQHNGLMMEYINTHPKFAQKWQHGIRLLST